MAATKFQTFAQVIGRAQANLNSDTIKFALSNVAPNAATGSVIADITEIANGNGYATGGATSAGTAYSQSGGTGTLTGGNVSWTSSGAGMATFRYIVAYDSTTNHLIAFADNGSGVTLAVGDTFLIDLSGGILTLA